jgi:hypothetical protein
MQNGYATRKRWSLVAALREIGEQVFRGDRQCFGKLDDIFKSDITLPSLNSPDVVAMQSGSLSKFFLGQASLIAQFAYRDSEPGFDRRRGHVPIFAA